MTDFSFWLNYLYRKQLLSIIRMQAVRVWWVQSSVHIYRLTDGSDQLRVDGVFLVGVLQWKSAVSSPVSLLPHGWVRGPVTASHGDGTPGRAALKAADFPGEAEGKKTEQECFATSPITLQGSSQTGCGPTECHRSYFHQVYF